MTKKLTAADLFCGAGGFTEGARLAGVDVCLAVNHWLTAVYSHQTNHPETRHICARIESIDIRHDNGLPDFDILLASPECTHHSIARGGRPVCDQKRQQPFALLDWLDARRPRWLVCENVREFRDWGPLFNNGTDAKPHWRPDPERKGETFAAWLEAIRSIGYQVDHQLLNAADFGAATNRTRLFVLARRGRSRRDIPFPTPTHARADWTPAWKVIDWSIPCPSIFGRKRPLAEKTIRRIEAGLRKFVGGVAEPFLVTLRRNMADRDPRLPLPTITAGAEHHGLATPYVLAINHGGDDDRSRPVDGPLGTLTTKNGHSVVVPFLTKYYGTGGVAGVDSPLDTITTRDRFGLAMVSLVETMRQLGVVDIGFRMLSVAELAAATGFPAGYYLHGTKADQVKQIGNAVSPRVAQALCATLAEAA